MSGTAELIRTDALEPHRDVLTGAAHRVVPEPAPERELPTQLIDKYVHRAMRRAVVKQYPDGNWFAEIPGFPGVWASQPSETATEEELRETLHEWILLKIQDQDRDLPVVDSVDLNVL